MSRTLCAAAIVLLATLPAGGHRLDEYLQGTIISVEKTRMDAQITLTPGVSVFRFLIADIDVNGDGTISENEQRGYAERMLHDLSISIDGHRLIPQLVSSEYPAIEEMQEGRGEIRIEIRADLPPGGLSRKLTFENHHQSRIAAYQVNCLIPRDPDIRILAQNRNYSQSFYELAFAQGGAPSAPSILARFSGAHEPVETVALIVVGWLSLVWRKRASRGEKS